MMMNDGDGRVDVQRPRSYPDIEGKKDDEGGDDGGDDDGKGRMMLLWVLMCNFDDVDEG